MKLFLFLTAIFMVVLYINAQGGPGGTGTGGTGTGGTGTGGTGTGGTGTGTGGQQCDQLTAPCDCSVADAESTWTNTGNNCTFYCVDNANENLSCGASNDADCTTQTAPCTCPAPSQAYWVNSAADGCVFYCRNGDQYFTCDSITNAGMTSC